MADDDLTVVGARLAAARGLHAAASVLDDGKMGLRLRGLLPQLLADVETMLAAVQAARVAALVGPDWHLTGGCRPGDCPGCTIAALQSDLATAVRRLNVARSDVSRLEQAVRDLTAPGTPRRRGSVRPAV